MTYRVRIKRPAEKEIRALPSTVRRRVHEMIIKLSEEPRPPGVRKVRGSSAWRVRVGDYRVVFRIDDREREVTIFLVKHRSDVYR